jgi:hypothetical protein
MQNSCDICAQCQQLVHNVLVTQWHVPQAAAANQFDIAH